MANISIDYSEKQQFGLLWVKQKGFENKNTPAGAYELLLQMSSYIILPRSTKLLKFAIFNITILMFAIGPDAL